MTKHQKCIICGLSDSIEISQDDEVKICRCDTEEHDPFNECNECGECKGDSP